MAARYPDTVAPGQVISSAWGNDTHDGFATLPLLQWGFFNGNTDSNGYARITWPIAYPGIAASGDTPNVAGCGVVAMQAAGAGGVVNVPARFFSLGGFNAGSAIVRVFNATGTAMTGVYTPFHFMVWGPRFAGQTSAGTIT